MSLAHAKGQRWPSYHLTTLVKGTTLWYNLAHYASVVDKAHMMGLALL